MDSGNETSLPFRSAPADADLDKRTNGYAALCDDCGLAIERGEPGRWTIAEPAGTRGRAA